MIIKLGLFCKDKGMLYKNRNFRLWVGVCSILVFKWFVDEFFLKKDILVLKKN